jgi:ABC-2 type transport system permease protein
MLALYFRLIGARIRAQMQYKVSFWLELIGFAAVTGLEFGVVVILFGRFPSVGGWTMAEVGLLYGISSISFGLAEMVGRGFDLPFEVMMLRGSFDGVMIRPLGSFFQILASEFQLRRMGRVFQGVAVLGYAFSQLSIAWAPAKLLILPLAIASAAVVYLALLVIGATVCFWTVKTPEVINIFTVGGDFLISYPLAIYNEWVRGVFLFVIPLAFCTYPAALLILGRSDPHGLPAGLAWAAPLIAGLFLILARGFWHVGVTYYQSTGS